MSFTRAGPPKAAPAPVNITCFQKLALRFFWAIIKYIKTIFWTFCFAEILHTRKKSSNLGKFPQSQDKIFQDYLFCITNCMNFHIHVTVQSVHFFQPTDRFQQGVLLWQKRTSTLSHDHYYFKPITYLYACSTPEPRQRMKQLQNSDIFDIMSKMEDDRFEERK